MTRLAVLFLPMAALATTAFAEPPLPVDAEVCVYGGTPSGVMAARLGHTVSLVDINAHTGGVVSGGLVATDMGDRKTVGGLADEFFLRIVRFYRGKFGDDSLQLKACRNGCTFQPHVAEAVSDPMLAGVGMGPREQRGPGEHRTMADNYPISIPSGTANRGVIGGVRWVWLGD